jgi:4-phospho-D-threonate 3-dehydrogenase / 4-phospho-D-erythronate 3-dehydrogenase
MKPKIALTMGDPAGIGPELAVRCATDATLSSLASITVFGCPEILKTAAERFAGGKAFELFPTGSLRFADMRPGRLDAACGKEAYETVRRATLEVIAGRFDAIVTCPVNKAAVNAAGVPFTGHTEMIAELCSTRDFAMMQSSGALRVAFVTTHIALAEVPSAVTRERILEVAGLLRDAIVSEGIARPKIAVAALNPHAGENGHMGMEDEQVVKPAIKELLAQGFDVEGPFPPDTLFIEQVRSRFDGILSMYHDQGHIPFKMLAFDSGVNSTLGLPIIRTSVDHGTAFEIAWQGVASTGSLEAAIKLAAKRASKAHSD